MLSQEKPTRARIKYKRTPYLIVSREASLRKDVYGSIDDHVVRHAQLLRGENASETAIVAMHPIGSPSYLPLFSELARAGMNVIGCSSRYLLGDAALQMENVLLDIGACVRDAKERLGYKKVILAGWSGGGSPMMTYQAEAENRTITETAAGEASPLAQTALERANGILFLAAPRSRHHLLTDFLDASVRNELEPDRNRDREFDLYDPANPNQAPYSSDYVASYRSRQRERNARITEFAQDKLAQLRRAGREQEEHGFVVHGTMADPRWLDPTLEPNERRPRWSYLGDPAIANMSPGALMRFTTTRSWLSQWSLRTAQVDAANSARRVSAPVLVLVNGGDDAVPVSHPQAVFDAIPHEDKQFVLLAGANHYFSGTDQRSYLSDAADIVYNWMERHGFV
jgi:dienelactone hydrolase